MNAKILFFFFLTILVFYNCTPQPTLSVYSEKDPKDNYILKWEIYPETDNTIVDIYVSDNDSVFPSSPTVTANSNDYIAIIKKDSDAMPFRKYFRIKINGAVSDVITNRFFEMDSIQNFRDIGGYTTADNKQMRWGKIFRSGALSRMTRHDSMELNTLGVKTIIDLRSEDVRRQRPYRYSAENIVRLPIAKSGYSSIAQQIMEDRFLRGDAIIHTQDTYRDMVNNFTSQFATFFDYLCNKDNYPVVFHCYLGKDQSGLATYFILKALDIPMETIEEDYMASGTGIDRAKLIRGADSLSESKQEALTMLTKTDLAYLRYAISCIREKSGSVEAYMENELKITPEKRQKLKDILLQ